MATQAAITLVNGAQRAVFVPAGAGWQPDWFYAGERPMLRFKDHEWLAIGQVHPTVATACELLPEGGAVFRGTSDFGQTPVAWAVTVLPDAAGGFLVECAIMPPVSVELLEAFSSFETPYDYDGHEDVTTVIGMNPVSCWHGNQRQSPPIYENPAWVYSRPQAVRPTAKCNAPYLCQAITGGHVPARFVTLAADWAVCDAQDLYAAPTRTVPHDPPAVFANPAERKGYKYLVGALNWSSAYAKDPNVIFTGGRTYRQRLAVDYANELPGGTLDAMLLRGWERAAAFARPADGKVKAYERAVKRGATWAAATRWLSDAFIRPEGQPELFNPVTGIKTYAIGTRPKAADDSGWGWWPQWAGLLHYRALLFADARLAEACARHDASFIANQAKLPDPSSIAMSVVTLPTLWWLHGAGRGGALQEALRPAMAATLARSEREDGGVREMDYGAQAAIAESLLLGADIYDAPAMRTQAQVLLTEMAVRADGNFWEFNCGKTGSLIHGGQIRALGHGHAVAALRLAWQQTGDAHYLDLAHRFARYLLAVNYANYNGSADPDFDWRGWCNGSNAGRDQIAEFPPWETQNGLLCLAQLLGDVELEGSFCDILWYIGRTGLAQFPAARTLKRVLDLQQQVHYVPRTSLASERDFYDTLPFLAYENPHDQTLLASYQGTDCLVGELVYGGGLVRAADARLGVLLPRAARLDPQEAEEHHVVLWNPTAKAIKTRLTVVFGTSSYEVPMTVPPREKVRYHLPRST